MRRVGAVAALLAVTALSGCTPAVPAPMRTVTATVTATPSIPPAQPGDGIQYDLRAVCATEGLITTAEDEGAASIGAARTALRSALHAMELDRAAGPLPDTVADDVRLLGDAAPADLLPESAAVRGARFRIGRACSRNGTPVTEFRTHGG